MGRKEDNSLENDSIRAIVLVNKPGECKEIVEACAARGIQALVRDDAARALQECRDNPPALAIVEGDLSPVSGYAFVADLLKISWTISSIIISGEEEAVVYEKAEGLGILGCIGHYRDRGRLERLLDDFMQVSNPVQRRTD